MKYIRKVIPRQLLVLFVRNNMFLTCSLCGFFARSDIFLCEFPNATTLLIFGVKTHACKVHRIYFKVQKVQEITKFQKVRHSSSFTISHNYCRNSHRKTLVVIHFVHETYITMRVNKLLKRCIACRRGLAISILSVCPSVCQLRALWQNEI